MNNIKEEVKKILAKHFISIEILNGEGVDELETYINKVREDSEQRGYDAFGGGNGDKYLPVKYIFPDKNPDFQRFAINWLIEFGKEHRTHIHNQYLISIGKVSVMKNILCACGNIKLPDSDFCKECV